MPSSIKELVTQDLQESLAAHSPAGGTDLESREPNPRGIPFKSGMVFVVDDGDTWQEDSPCSKDDYSASYSLEYYITVSDATDGSAAVPQHELARLRADIVAAIMQDVTRGGHAINTTLGSDSSLPQNDERDGYTRRVQSITVHYRTAKDDPFTE